MKSLLTQEAVTFVHQGLAMLVGRIANHQLDEKGSNLIGIEDVRAAIRCGTDSVIHAAGIDGERAHLLQKNIGPSDSLGEANLSEGLKRSRRRFGMEYAFIHELRCVVEGILDENPELIFQSIQKCHAKIIAQHATPNGITCSADELLKQAETVRKNKQSPAMQNLGLIALRHNMGMYVAQGEPGLLVYRPGYLV